MAIAIYVDESGDLGWKFDAPYRRGGSSRHLTISAIIIDYNQHHLLKRLMKDLYRKTKTDPKTEIKWALMDAEQRLWVANRLAKLKQKLGSDVSYHSITVFKQNVAAHIRTDANKLYNYMLKFMLLQEMAKHEKVFLSVDQRSIKVASGNSLHDYLQTELWLGLGQSTQLKTEQCDSKHHLCIQAADVLSGIVQNHFEDSKSEPFAALSDNIVCKTLFFGDANS